MVGHPPSSYLVTILLCLLMTLHHRELQKLFLCEFKTREVGKSQFWAKIHTSEIKVYYSIWKSVQDT